MVSIFSNSVDANSSCARKSLFESLFENAWSSREDMNIIETELKTICNASSEPYNRLAENKGTNIIMRVLIIISMRANIILQ